MERHGKRGHPLYVNWRAMRWRCLSPQADGWSYYGGRGIRICEEWDSFGRFYEWAVGNGWEPGLTIDRKDIDGNYEPSNCRWATAAEQTANRRRHRCAIDVTINGRTMSLRQWARASGIGMSTLHKRYERGVRGRGLIAPPEPARSHKA